MNAAEWRRLNPDKVKAYNARYHAEHREKIAARMLVWRAANKEKISAYDARQPKPAPEIVKARRLRAYRKNPEKAKARAREWRQENLARARARSRSYSAAHRAEKREYDVVYRKTNHAARLADCALRRAQKRGARIGCRKAYAAFVGWARTEESIACHWCHEETKPGERHRDHIIPISRGGADSVENLCVACPTCNLKKGTRMPDEFVARIA